MNILENFPLKELNTFNIECNAKYFVRLTEAEQIKSLINTQVFKKNKFLVLGGGSNILFSHDFTGLIIQPKIDGIEILDETNMDIRISVGCGIEWDNLVAYCVAHNWGGIENLSKIPGFSLLGL